MLASSKDSWTKDARGEEGAVMFLRRTDRNVNCKAYTRVVVICKDFGLAAIQYYFKNAEEQTFEIASSQPKGVRASALYSTGRTTRSNAKRKAEGDEGGGDDGGEENGAAGRGTPLRLGIVSPAIVRPIRNDTVPTRNVVNNPHLPPIEDITAQTMLSYLKNHVVLERQERAEERKLRREELEERKRERNEDRQLRKDETDARKREKLEEMEMRKQELSLERAKLTLDQQRWEMDRKEKEMFLELLRKKLIHE